MPAYPVFIYLLLFSLSISGSCCFGGSSIRLTVFCCLSHSPGNCLNPVLHIFSQGLFRLPLFHLPSTFSSECSSGLHAFPFPIFAICFSTSSNEKHSTLPSVVGDSSSCSLRFSALKSLSKYCFPIKER